MDSVAIVALQAADAGRIAAHLLRLSPEDRSLRFAAGLVTDQTICAYVRHLRFGHDAVFGLVDAAGAVAGLAHGCLFEDQGRPQIEAAFSVDAALRGLGFGARLMATLGDFAARRGAALVGLCHVRNLPMRRIFERAGMTLTREDDEMHARCDAAPRTPVLSGRSGKLHTVRAGLSPG
jgi:GNAT superfamily N-acetyltransferase